MKIQIAALALAAFLAAPTAGNAAKHATKHVAKHPVHHSKVIRQSPRYYAAQPFSPYVHRPEYDVYVYGEYVGSDPDPRIRESMRQRYFQYFLWH
jgi:hypothetical protein